LNYLLSLNKKTVLILSLIFITFVLLGFFFKYFQLTLKNNDFLEISSSESDIIKPKFSINSEKQKIAVTAKKGNFISENKILLKKDVIFKSKKFKIMSDDVIFDKKYLTASSSKKSKFISKKTSIISNGFEIVDNGNKIYFNGKTILIIK
jgi:hypothetical protein